MCLSKSGFEPLIVLFQVICFEALRIPSVLNIDRHALQQREPHSGPAVSSKSAFASKNSDALDKSLKSMGTASRLQRNCRIVPLARSCRAAIRSLNKSQRSHRMRDPENAEIISCVRQLMCQSVCIGARLLLCDPRFSFGFPVNPTDQKHVFFDLSR